MGKVSLSKKKALVYIGLGLVLVAVAAGGWYAVSRRSESDQPKPRVSVEVDALTAEASELSIKGDIAGALAKLDEYIASNKGTDKEQSAALQARASYYVRQPNKTESAFADLRAALALTPDDPRIYVSIGNLYVTSNDSGKAKENYQKALEVYDGGAYKKYELQERSYYESFTSNEPTPVSGNLSEPQIEGDSQ